MTTEQKAKCRQILSHYGIEKQRRQLVEECGELIQAIMKLERTDKERVHYIEELADVEIMMEQMKISLQTYDPLGWDIFTDMIEQKINRQLDRIAEEEAAKLQTTLYICDPEKNTECKKTSCKAYKHVKHGRWIDFPECLEYEGALDSDYFVCSECHHVWNTIDNCAETFKYCPNCGSKNEDGDSE